MAGGAIATDGLHDLATWRGRQDDYLAAATQRFVPWSPLNVIDHLARAERDPDHEVDWTQVDHQVLARWTHRIDRWLDCADFDVLRLLVLLVGHGHQLPERVTAHIRDRVLGFRYWYTDPVEPPAGTTDERWYWSENHRLIFHTCELLAGEALPDERFTVAGLTGREHAARAAPLLDAWVAEKAVDGFSEWHSDAYYAKDLAPLVALAELAADPARAEQAAALCDLVLYDLALHTHRGNVGCTHGRAYMRHKAQAADQPVYGAVRLCFGVGEAPWPVETGDEQDLLPRNESATFFARARRYRPPAILARIAASEEEVLDEEAMGFPIDPSGPVVPGTTVLAGKATDDPDLVPYWWDRSALTPWQLVPLTVATLDRHQLWDADLFHLFRTVRDAFGGDVELMQQLAADLHPMVNAGLLEEVHTCTWRNGHGLLSTAQAYRPGTVGFQHHTWQATLDETAVVFTTHPGNPPSALAGDYRDHDRYWTGSATLPHSVQHRRVAIHRYEPAFASPTDDLLAPFAYEPSTHAFLPTEHFDEVRRHDRWTLARRRDGYVALWSWRPPTWRHHDPAEVFTNGLTDPFDLVADGGADNVWICELGDVDRWGSFDRFEAAILAAEVEVQDPAWDGAGAHPGFAVRYASPAEGTVESRPDAPLRVNGSDVAIRYDRRLRNRYSEVGRGETVVEIADRHGAWVLDLAAGTRRPGPARSS